MKFHLFFLTIFSALSFTKIQAQTPPYSGTIFIDPDIIISSDPSAIQSTTYTGRGQRTVYDRRVNNWISVNGFLFNVIWNDGITSEAIVNPEFGTLDSARIEAERYARIIGQLPNCLRTDVDQIWIHKGKQPFGGGNNSILIHTGQSADYEASGILEETLVHEAAHTSLDLAHSASAGWKTAQTKDVNFISTYAKDNPTREDIAESFLPWLMVKYKAAKIPITDFNKINQAIPNRLAYFDNQSFNLYPFFGNKPVVGIDCSNATAINIGKTFQGNTNNGKSNVSTYNNDLWWQLTGPEMVHKLEWPGGDVSIKLSNKAAAVDLILLRSCNNNDFIASGGGNSGLKESTIKQYLDPGVYYIVVDGWQLAKGTYDLLVLQSVSVSVSINSVTRNFYLQDNTLYEQSGTSTKVMATGVEEFSKYFGYVTNTNTGEGQQQEVLSIKKTGEPKPKIFLNENFNTDYLKQILFCPQKNLSLYGDLVFDGNNQILSGCDVLRCENGQTVAHQKDSKIKLYSSLGTNNWLDILQIITVDSISYCIKQSDSTVWALNGSGDQAKLIGTKAKLLQDNDNQLIKIDAQGNYQRWNGSSWSNVNPKYISVSPEMTDEGFWFFMQAKSLLESTAVQTDHKKALTFDKSDKLLMELIPATGNCDRFLWRTKDIGGGKRILINKAKGENFPLLLSASGTLSFTGGQGVQAWEIKYADLTKYGTNAFQLIGANAARALSFSSSVQAEAPVASNKNQAWVFQFNQMVRDYFLPLPTRANLDLHYVDNPNVNLNLSAKSIADTYNKFLKGNNGVTFFATNTGSDWAIVNYYFVINNMMNAVIAPKPSDPKVDPNLVKTLSAMKGQSLILINKNDLNSAVPNHFFTRGFNSFSVASLRGSAGYLAANKWILVSEELTCKTGIVNRPLDRTFRRFDHGVHEFGHALQQLCNWMAIVDANNMCDAERNRSSECFCYDMQNWFNSVGGYYTYPGLRATIWGASPSISGAQRSDFMKKIFNEANTWMPPVDLRLNGYNPSGSSSISTAVREVQNGFSIRAYPNPFKEFLNIEVELDHANPAELEITDALGRVLSVKKSTSVTDKHFFQIQNLDYSGILFVRVKSAGKYSLVKVIKKK